MRKLALAAVSLAALAIAPSSASAARLGDGITALDLTRKAVKALGVELTPTGAAQGSQRGVIFPITGGKLVGLSGNVRHDGGVRIAKGRREVTLSNFRIVFDDHPFVQVRVDGGEALKAFTLDVDDAEIDDDVLQATYSNIDVDLARQGSRALNAALKTRAFETATKVAELGIVASPRAVKIKGGQTDLALAKTAADAFASLGVTVAGTEGTVANPNGSLGFPIRSGRLTEDDGTISHNGGITLKKGQTTVALTGFVIDTKAKELSAHINGATGLTAILSLDLDGGDAAATDSTLTIEDVTARLTSVAAGALNQSFSTSAFQAGQTLGTATIRAEATN